MHNESLYDHKGLQIHSLLLLLHLNSDHMHKSKLCNALKITAPTLNQLIEQIKLFDPELLTIDRHEISLNLPYNSRPVSKLTSHLLRTSLRFQLLDFYFKHSTLTREEVARLLNISLTSTNKLISECNNLLKEFDLTIKQNKLRGTGIQFFYFYFNFYWNNHGNSALLDSLAISDHGFKKFAEDKLSSHLNVIQKDQISLWLSLLGAKHELIAEQFSTAEMSQLEKDVSETPLYKTLTIYFKQNWIFLDQKLINYYSYLTFVFLNTHNIINYPITEINSIFKNSLCQQLLEQVTTILTSSYNFKSEFASLRSSLYFTINKLLLLKGYYYTTNLLNLEAKMTEIQPFEEKVINEILSIPLAKKIWQDPFKLQAIRDNLKIIIYPHKNLKRRCINIGVISQMTIATRYAYITEIQNVLGKGHNISVNDYVEDTSYDLLVSDFNSNELTHIKTPVLFLDDLDIQSNIELLEKEVSRIEGETYTPLLLI